MRNYDLLNLTTQDVCWEMADPGLEDGAPLIFAMYAISDKNPNAGLLRPFKISSGPANETRVPGFGDVLREIWFTHTTAKVDCELGIQEGYTIAKFRSTGGAQNRVFLWRHGCQIPLKVLGFRTLVLRAELPAGTPLTLLIGLASSIHCGLFNNYYLFPTGVIADSTYIPISLNAWSEEEPETYTRLLSGILERAASKEHADVYDTAKHIWQSGRPWDRTKIEGLLAAGRARRSQQILCLLAAILCRMPRPLVPRNVCPVLLERCAVWDCSYCPAVIRILKACVPCGVDEWEQLFWPFFGGTRECDLPQAECCEWIP